MTKIPVEKLPENIPLLFRERAESSPGTTLQIVRNEVGEYESFTYRRVYNRVIETACALKALGVRRGAKIGFIADNRSEWLVLDLAVLSLGACDIPRGCDSTGTEIAFILNFVKCETAVFENERQLKKVLECGDEVPTLRTAVLIDSPGPELVEAASVMGITVCRYIDLEDEGSRASKTDREAVEAEMERTNRSDLATIIFTSGTTGTPKGVMLTHDNYLAQCEVVKSALPNTKDGDIWLSVLPVWHSFERVIQYFVITLRSGIAYSKPASSVMLADMAAVHPTWMCGVPRLWESLAHGIFKKVKKENRVTQITFSSALSAGRMYFWAKTHVCGLRCRFNKTSRVFDFFAGIVPFLIIAPVHLLYELTVYRKVRSVLGGKMVAAISGGGALQADVEAFYHAVGFNLIEGYGMTESAPILSLRNPVKPRPGCVGAVFPSAEVKVVTMNEDGTPGTETLSPGKKGIIVARGRQIMKGYYERPDLTAQVIDKDGWLNTGDIGMMTYDGEIKITGRAKDTIVLLGGENVEPAVIESALVNSAFIERAVVLGQDKKYISALIVPAKEELIEWADTSRIMYDSYESLLESNEVQMMYRTEIDSRVSGAKGFRTCERIGRFVLIPESFTQGKEINAKGEMMRARIRKIYEREIRKLYTE